MKIYYAHHLWKYGTEIEAWELDLIRQRFPGCEIVNPNGAIEQGRPVEDIMADCLQKVRECDALVFSSLSGVIGKGVYNEVKIAKACGIPCYYIHHGRLWRGKVLVNLRRSGNHRLYADVWLDGELKKYE